jgi:hypothetical protein
MSRKPLTVSLPPFPLPLALLERYRIRSRQRSRPSLVGGHLMRRKGQSLEFRELVPYTIGDDIRYVDWRASARHEGTAHDLLIRSFVTEEQLTLVVSVDNRASMRLPMAMPKLQIALWLAEAVVWIALRSGDRVFLHRLFGGGRVQELSGSGSIEYKWGNARSVLRRLGEEAESSSVNLAMLRPHLPPAAVWLILTDLYFEDDQAQRLARGIAAARDGQRWVILVDMDSWPYEKTMLGQGARLIEGPGIGLPETPVDINHESIQQVAAKIDAHKQRFRRAILRAGCDIGAWKWPEAERPDPEQFFRKAFVEDRLLGRLFMKEA